MAKKRIHEPQIKDWYWIKDKHYSGEKSFGKILCDTPRNRYPVAEFLIDNKKIPKLVDRYFLSVVPKEKI